MNTRRPPIYSPSVTHAARESQTVEFKRGWRDEFLKELCGFANAQGGTLVLGVDDGGNVVGVENARKLMEDIPNKVVSLLGIVADVDLVRRGDRLELWNEGKLPEGYTVKKLLGAHASRPRNRNLAAAFYRAGFIEAWGRGIEKIRGGMAAAGLPAPLFESTCGGVKVTLSRPEKAESATTKPATKTTTKTTLKTTQKTKLKTARKEEVEGTARKIAELMAANPDISIGEIVERTGLTRDGVNYHIRALKTKAGLVRVGGRKTGHWEFKEEP